MCFKDIDFQFADHDDEESPDFQMDYCETCGEMTVHLGTLGGECSQCFDDRYWEKEE